MTRFFLVGDMEDHIVKAKDNVTTSSDEEDFGLERMHQEYHRHGGTQGDAQAKKLEGDIATSHAQHDHELKKGRPDGLGIKRS